MVFLVYFILMVLDLQIYLQLLLIFLFISQLILIPSLSKQALAQGYDDPLNIQGLNHVTLQSAASRAMGGTTLNLYNDAGVMFLNSASLQSLKGLQLSISGLQQFVSQKQVQQYTPLKYYSNFSLLMEGLTDLISNPDTSLHGTNPGDTVQRAFDKIGPNWSYSRTKSLPIQVMLAMPFNIGESKFAIGIGSIEYANLEHYYRNNNVLSPAVGSVRPFPTDRPINDSTPVRTEWSAFERWRTGSIRGYGMAISGSLSGKIDLGVSGMMLEGSTDDFEQSASRGRLVFYKTWFRLEPRFKYLTRSGESKYSGYEFTFSGIYHAKYVNFGFMVKPPMTITRKYSTNLEIDTLNYVATVPINGKDNITLPWRWTFGLSINLVQNLTLSMEYEVRPYASATYWKEGGEEILSSTYSDYPFPISSVVVKSKPWLSSSILHVGAAYEPSSWLVLRAGARGQSEVFEPTGNAIIGEPVSYSIYSAGCGLTFSGLRLNLTYEYSMMKYIEMWQTNININTEKRNNIIADIVIQFP